MLLVSTACGGSGPLVVTTGAVVARTEAQHTAHYRLVERVSGSTTAIEGDLDFGRRVATANSSVVSHDPNTWIDVGYRSAVTTGGKTYLRITDDPAHWYVAHRTMYPIGWTPYNVLELIRRSASLVRTGAASVDGVETTKYLVTGRAGDAAATDRSSAWIWVDHDGRVRRFAQRLTQRGSTGRDRDDSIRVDFSDLGKRITISAPTRHLIDCDAASVRSRAGRVCKEWGLAASSIPTSTTTVPSTTTTHS
jgi:hypothetical protein